MKNLFLIYCLFSSLLGFSQNSQKRNTVSVVSYEEVSLPPVDGLKKFPTEMQEMAKNHKEVPTYYELLFNDTEAIYKKTEKKTESQPDEMGTGNIQMKVTKVSVGENVELYKNYKTKTSVALKKILDKEFLISEDLKTLHWELINETKTIGNLECKKAQTKIGNGEVIEVWYAPSIPVNAGPSLYWGLPGLIVEVKEKTKHYIATQIKENISNKIEAPTKGKKISNNEFLKLVAERVNDLTKDKSSFRVVNE